MLRSILHKSQPFVAYRFYSTSRSAKQITSSQLTEWMNQKKLYSDMIIVDVRERSEIEEKGKIKGALNIPFSLSAELFKGALSEFNKETPVRS